MNISDELKGRTLIGIIKDRANEIFDDGGVSREEAMRLALLDIERSIIQSRMSRACCRKP